MVHVSNTLLRRSPLFTFCSRAIFTVIRGANRTPTKEKRTAVYPKFESAVCDWVKGRKSQGSIVTNKDIREKAKQKRLVPWIHGVWKMD